MARRERIRVVVADDHPMFRDGLARAVKERPELDLVAEASNGREAVELVDELRPDVAVLDVKMPGLEGLQILEALRSRGSDSRVIFLSAHVNGEIVHESLSAGAMGFYSKEAGRQEICDAIVKIANGEVLLDPRLEAGLLSTIRAQADVKPGAAFTKRELEVLQLAGEGRSTSQIAQALQLSPETIKSHLKNVFEKLGVSSRTAAVAEGIRRGILD